LGEEELVDDRSVDFDYPDGADMEYEGDQPQFDDFDIIGN
jgi:hypothetical protein